MTNTKLDFEQRQQAERMAENGDQLDQCFELVAARAEIEKLNRKCSALALLLYGPNPNAVEPSEQRKVAYNSNGDAYLVDAPSQKSEAVALAHSTDVRQEIKGKGDVPDSQFAGILKAAESGDAVNTMDLINALWWRVGNQKREIARLHTSNKAASCPTDFNGDPIKPKGL